MHRAVSVVDLLSIEESREIIKSGDKGAFMALLYSIGFDINQPVDYQICHHRSLVDGQVHYTGRWVGSERGDKEWMESEYCTLDNRIEKVGVKDLVFQEDLVRMSSLPNYTAMTIDKIRTSRNDYNSFDEHLDIFEEYKE